MLYAIVAVIALIFDQLLKYWTTVHVAVNTGEKKLIPGLIHIANIHNTGAAFSFLEGARWFFVILCVVFVIAVIFLLAKNIISAPGARWCAVIVMAGAVGNAIDRVITGYVVDMFEFEFVRFPVFNLADIYITLGAILFCVFLLTDKPKAADAAEAESPRGKKTEIPTFPKREPLPEPPPMDPNDPFAEWERMANTGGPAPVPQPAGNRVDYTQPAAAEEQPRITPPEPPVPAAPVAEAQLPAPTVLDGQTSIPLPETPAPAMPAAEAPRPAPAARRINAAPEDEGISNTERVMRLLVHGTAPSRPVVPAPETPPAPVAEPAAAPPKAPAPAPGPTGDGISYDLDDILAEFKDL